ncbi:Uncharacterised protein [Mycobacteroides abscessus subsp. abscessus]|nr:Uncharacterised protein [Mycobacteroides abscessus subsp. abscessus]
MVPIKNSAPAMEGPTMKAPDETRLLIPLNRFRLAAGTSMAIYVVDAGAKNAFARLMTNKHI